MRVAGSISQTREAVAAHGTTHTGVWTHFALTRDAAGTLRIYVDGVLVATGPAPFNQPLYVGRLGGGLSYALDGMLDDVRIWSVARSASQIAAARSQYVDPGAAGLERLYAFDDSTTRVTDLTGNSGPGSLDTTSRIEVSDAPTTTLPSAPDAPAAGAEVTGYVYDIDTVGGLAQNDIVIEIEGNDAEGSSRRWLHSHWTDEPIAFEAYAETQGSAGSGTALEVFSDRLGSVVAFVDSATGSVRARYSYDQYGARARSGPMDQLHGFTGRRFDPESGLLHFYKRALDPSIGKFLQLDPIEFSSNQLNLSAYADTNPTNPKDPSGLAIMADRRMLVGKKQTTGAVTRIISAAVLETIISIFENLDQVMDFGGGPMGIHVAGDRSGGDGWHKNNKKCSSGAHVYVIYDKRNGNNLKVGISNNTTLYANDTRSTRADSQFVDSRKFDYVVMSKTPDGFASRAIGLIMEQMMVNAISSVYGPMDPDWHQRPQPSCDL